MYGGRSEWFFYFASICSFDVYSVSKFDKLCSAAKENPMIENRGLIFAKFKPKKLIVTAGPLSKRNKYEIISNKEELLTQA